MNNKFKDEYGNEREDSLDEQQFIQEFNNSIESTQFHVYGLSGDWGTGKSAFIQMWEDSIDKEKYSVIHIDAFEKDYIQNPFSMIYEAFKKFMKENKISKKDAKTVVEKAKKIAFASAKAAGQFGINLLIDKIGTENVNALVSAVSDSVFEEFDYNPEKEEVNLCKELKDSLSLMVKKANKTLYIVIDELDRCRPDFALETLEKIKHLFTIDGVKFILVYNNEVIANIVKNKYGLENSNNKYIKKFIEKEIPFSTSSIYSAWIRSEAEQLKSKGVYPPICQYIGNWANTLSKVMIMFNLSLRDMQRILISIDTNNMLADPYSNIVFGFTIAFLKAINLKEYNGMIDYLKKNNGKFASNAPNTNTYIKLTSILMHKTDDPVNMFIEYFNKKVVGNY